MDTFSNWNSRTEAHHDQSLRTQGTSAPPEDFWRPFASGFRTDPRRTDDPVLDRLLREVKPEWTILDVGGGAGRFALPLAVNSRHVTVVDPSKSMVEALEEAAKEANIKNLSI